MSEDKRGGASVQRRRWKSCARHCRGAGRAERDWTKRGRRAARALLCGITGHQPRGRRKRWVRFGKSPSCPTSSPPPSACLQLRDIWLWLDARVLQELQLFHIICPRASSSLCQGEGGQSCGCLLYRTSLTAGQKEAAESLSCLQNLQQEELRRFNESIQTKNLPQPAVQLMLIEH